MKNNAKTIVIGIIAGLAILMSCLSLFLIFFRSDGTLSAEKIYQNNLHTIVEVKSFTDEVIMYGSAVCIDDGGLFITNAHVVSYEEYTEVKLFENIQIRFSNSDEYIDASLDKIDYTNDLALIRVESCANIAKPVKMRVSEPCEGETVYAVGNAQNYGISISNGIISQRKLNVEIDDRSITAIQCSLNITEGNSGGALLDAFGNLIGITTFRLRDKLGNVVYGLCFALPVNLLKDFIAS